jgi:hypothetical protein
VKRINIVSVCELPQVLRSSVCAWLAGWLAMRRGACKSTPPANGQPTQAVAVCCFSLLTPGVWRHWVLRSGLGSTASTPYVACAVRRGGRGGGDGGGAWVTTSRTVAEIQWMERRRSEITISARPGRPGRVQLGLPTPTARASAVSRGVSFGLAKEEGSSMRSTML